MTLLRAVITSLLLVFVATSFCTSEAIATDTTLYYYSAENCPHCKEYGPRIHSLANQFEDVALLEKDIWKDREAFDEMLALIETHGDLPVTTPTLFLGDQVWVGIDDNKLLEIEKALRHCIHSGCRDAKARLHEAAPPQAEQEQVETVDLPLLGETDAREVSLPLITMILGLLDSINPCAFFVLLFLLTLMVHAHSRARMLTVGIVFITFSGLIYFLFMAAWLNLFLATGGIRIVTLFAGLVALTIGAFNIKDYFLFHRGPSLSIPEKVKPGLYHRVRELVKSTRYLSLLGGTVLLAIAANSYELLCTAGFPMVFTRILTLQELPTLQYYAYIAFYNLVYVTPLMIIVMIFAVTLGAHQLTENQGRFLKLLSGVMMTVMGGVLIFFPAQLQSLSGALAMFGTAVIAIILIMALQHMIRAAQK